MQAAEERYDRIVFHATGTGGQSMEKPARLGLLAGVLDVTTTEIADELVGGCRPQAGTFWTCFREKAFRTWHRAARSTW